MSDTKNKAFIGAFVVGATVLAVVGVLVFGGGEFFVEKMIYVMYFEDAIKGLNVGSPVMFRGVKIGSVTEISIRNPKDWSTLIAVVIEVDQRSFDFLGEYDTDEEENMQRLIDNGLRARLETQSLVTGQAIIQVEILPDEEVRLIGDKNVLAKKGYIEVPTVPSTMSRITKRFENLDLEEIGKRLIGMTSSIETFMNNPELTEAVSTLNQTLLKVDKLVDDANREIVPAAGRLLGNVDTFVVDMHGDIKPLLASAKGAADSFKATSNGARPAIESVDRAFDNIASLTGRGSAERRNLDNMLKELTGAARSIKNWASYLERNPEALIRGRQNPRQRR